MNKNHSVNIIGLDIGDARVGVARVHSVAKIPEPLSPLANDDQFVTNLRNLLENQGCKTVVVGLPRNMSGEETAQSQKIRDFVTSLQSNFEEVNFIFVDESLSSARADEYIKKSKLAVSQDSVAACYILQEYLTISG